MQSSPSPISAAVVDAARSVLIRSMAPFGAQRMEQLYREGLSVSFRPAFDYLFSKKVTPQDLRVVERVEAMRAALARRSDELYVFSFHGEKVRRTPQVIASRSSVTREWGTFLYLLAKGFHADTILELGSCAGISGSYLASAPTCREFVSIEKSPALAPIANSHITQVSQNATVINAAFDDVLTDVLARFGNNLSLYYVDGNHTYQQTMRSTAEGLVHLKPGALVVYDDIHWSKEMWDAWQLLRARQGFTHTLDVGRFGLCVWAGGAVQPRAYKLAKYTGWVRDYAPT